MKTIKTLRKLVYERASEYSCKNLKKIEVRSGDYTGSGKCHEKAFDVLYNSGDDVVVALSFVPKSGVNVHFVNFAATGYFDHTLGYLSRYNTYYEVARFNERDLKDYDHPLGAEYLLMEFKFAFIDLLFSPEEQKQLGVGVKHI